ncbi:MAG TPA: hypothetical protein VGC32_20925 [Solirubrobacterales bacterium]
MPSTSPAIASAPRAAGRSPRATRAKVSVREAEAAGSQPKR